MDKAVTIINNRIFILNCLSFNNKPLEIITYPSSLALSSASAGHYRPRRNHRPSHSFQQRLPNLW
jgi:hypothetical protein